jgi:hypothetical protein
MEKLGKAEWEKLIDKLSEKFEPGELISHDYLKRVLFIDNPKFEDFETQSEFVEALNLVQFEYMSLVDKLRWDILDRHKLYLRNIRGDGYVFLIPAEQTEFAKAQTMDTIRKELKRGFLILQNIRFAALSQDQKRMNADEMAKLGQLSQLLKVLK